MNTSEHIWEWISQNVGGYFSFSPIFSMQWHYKLRGIPQMDGIGKSREKHSLKPTQQKTTVALEKKGKSELGFSQVKEPEEGPGAVVRIWNESCTQMGRASCNSHWTLAEQQVWLKSRGGEGALWEKVSRVTGGPGSEITNVTLWKFQTS